jgi:tRNA A64-2'-O-ribosylphosphate transferase
MWITPATTTFPSLPDNDRTFLPVVCVSASKQVTSGTERRTVGFSYIQGSGDDHELWSMVRTSPTYSCHSSIITLQGLTPNLFWRNREDLLAANRSQLPELISSLLVEGPSDGGIPPSSVAKVGGRLLVCAISDLGESRTSKSLYHGRGADGANIAYVFLTSDNDSSTEVFPDISPALRMQVPDGKKGQMHFLQAVLPRSMVYIQAQLSEDKRLCIACKSGQDMSVGVVLAALQKFFDDDGNLIPAGITPATRR